MTKMHILKTRSILACFFGITLMATQAQALGISSYDLQSHEGNNNDPPLYGLALRLDFTGGPLNQYYTFDFDHASSNMRLDYDGSSIHIHGTSYGGKDIGSTYGAGTDGLWNIDFLYDTGLTNLGDAVKVVTNAQNFGTLNQLFGAGDSWNLRDKSNGSYSYYAGVYTKNGVTALGGKGWLMTNLNGNNNWRGGSDFGHKMTPTPEPAAFVLFGSGLAGLGFWRWKKTQSPASSL